jgi:hypothetical protein
MGLLEWNHSKDCQAKAGVGKTIQHIETATRAKQEAVGDKLYGSRWGGVDRQGDTKPRRLDRHENNSGAKSKGCKVGSRQARKEVWEAHLKRQTTRKARKEAGCEARTTRKPTTMEWYQGMMRQAGIKQGLLDGTLIRTQYGNQSAELEQAMVYGLNGRGKPTAQWIAECKARDSERQTATPAPHIHATQLAEHIETASKEGSRCFFATLSLSDRTHTPRKIWRDAIWNGKPNTITQVRAHYDEDSTPLTTGKGSIRATKGELEIEALTSGEDWLAEPPTIRERIMKAVRLTHLNEAGQNIARPITKTVTYERGGRVSDRVETIAPATVSKTLFTLNQ